MTFSRSQSFTLLISAVHMAGIPGMRQDCGIGLLNAGALDFASWPREITDGQLEELEHFYYPLLVLYPLCDQAGFHGEGHASNTAALLRPKEGRLCRFESLLRALSGNPASIFPSLQFLSSQPHFNAMKTGAFNFSATAPSPTQQLDQDNLLTQWLIMPTSLTDRGKDDLLG